MFSHSHENIEIEFTTETKHPRELQPKGIQIVGKKWKLVNGCFIKAESAEKDEQGSDASKL